MQWGETMAWSPALSGAPPSLIEEIPAHEDDHGRAANPARTRRLLSGQRALPVVAVVRPVTLWAARSRSS